MCLVAVGTGQQCPLVPQPPQRAPAIAGTLPCSTRASATSDPIPNQLPPRFQARNRSGEEFPKQMLLFEECGGEVVVGRIVTTEIRARQLRPASSGCGSRRPAGDGTQQPAGPGPCGGLWGRRGGSTSTVGLWWLRSHSPAALCASSSCRGPAGGLPTSLVFHSLSGISPKSPAAVLPSPQPSRRFGGLSAFLPTPGCRDPPCPQGPALFSVSLATWRSPGRLRRALQLSSGLGVQEELVWENQMSACFHFPGWGCLT